jgi:glycosidase
VFYYYQKLISLRKSYEVFREGSFTLVEPEHEQVFAYTRDTEQEHLLVVCNFTDKEIPFARPEQFQRGRLLISNYGGTEETLRPYEAQMFYLGE